MKIAIIAHAGEAKGHILRAIALQRCLEEVAETTLIVPKKSRAFVETFFPEIACEWITWPFGHNDVLDQAVKLSTFVEQLKLTTLELEKLFHQSAPNLVIGIPGVESSALCRVLGVPHISVLHGPWLVPEYILDEPTPSESAVVVCWERSIEITQVAAKVVSHALGAMYGKMYRPYRTWLESEVVWVAQDFNVEYKNKRPVIGFLQADYGPTDTSGLPNNCLTITLGSAIDGDKKILGTFSHTDMSRLIISNSLIAEQPKVHWRPALSGASIASLSSVAINHGGIGTTAVFATAGVPQVFVPHDIDQAVNAFLAQRSGFGVSTATSQWWRKRTPFGRICPPLIKGRNLGQLVREVMQNPLHQTPAINNKAIIQSLAREACGVR